MQKPQKQRSGFTAYCIYLCIKKMHFKSNSFNAGSLKNNPFKQKFINSWNSSRVKKDGIFFQEIENKYPHVKSLVLLFSSYYINDSEFYVKDILNDKYDTFKKNLSEIKNIETVFTNDLQQLILTSKQQKKRPKQFLVSGNSIPKIFKMDLSLNTLVILQRVFNIIELNQSCEVSKLEERRWNELKLKLIKYEMIIDEFIQDYDWKQITKNILLK